MNHLSPRRLMRSENREWGKGSRARFAVRPEPRGALVFVHGFRGSAMKTWLDFPTWLPWRSEASGYDLLFYGYDTRQQASFSSGDLLEFLKAVADQPGDAVINPSLDGSEPRRTSGFRYQRIVIAAHSLGAVVTRLALLDAADAGGPPAWLAKVRLALFAPAHNGALAAQLATKLLLGFGAGSALESLVRKHYLSVNDLDEDSAVLTRIRTETAAILANGASQHADCHRAVGAIGGKDWVVYQGKFPGDQSYERWSDLDHFEVCKPSIKDPRPLDFLLKVIQ